MTTEQMIDALLRKNNGNARSVIAWLIGNLESYQIQANEVRASYGYEKRETVTEWLEREADQMNDRANERPE